MYVWVHHNNNNCDCDCAHYWKHFIFWFSTQGDIFGGGSGGPVVFILMVYIYIK